MWKDRPFHLWRPQGFCILIFFFSYLWQQKGFGIQYSKKNIVGLHFLEEKTCKGWAGTQINSTMFCLKIKVFLLFVRSKTTQTNILERKSHKSPKVKISFEKLWCLSSVLEAQTGFQKSKVQIHCLELWGVHHNISNLELISFQCFTSVFFVASVVDFFCPQLQTPNCFCRCLDVRVFHSGCRFSIFEFLPPGCFCALRSPIVDPKLLLRVFGCDSAGKKVSTAFQRRGRNPLIQFMPPPTPLLDLSPNTPIHLWATSEGKIVVCEWWVVCKCK